MSGNSGNKFAAPRKGGNPLLTGILVGMVIGAGMAAGLAWYVMKSPSPFLQKEQGEVKPPIAAAKPLPPAGTAASGVSDGKPRFEFYKVLTDKQDTDVVLPSKPADKPRPADSKPVASNVPQILQAGSFSNAGDAEKLKARLAFLGVEASIQTATIPDKGVWYRVRLGPYKNTDEMDRARSFLKQNGVDSTPMRAQ